ncbi:MAG: amidase family protein [Desulfobacterales bacterium]|jgi:Asp-tRNA(Asn)/Glu-tRNA(Gln) amidotransferase A subunit family amidase
MALCRKVLQLSAVIVLTLALFCCEKQDSSTRPPPKNDPLLFKSATELTNAIRRGEITSLDLLNRYLEKIQRNNDRINAVVALDVEAARARAAEADKALAEGQDWGLLHGLPMTVKDVFEPELLAPRKKQFSDYRVAVWLTDTAPTAEIDADVLSILKQTVEKLRKSGLPVGVQIIGARYEDRTTIDFAKGLSELVGGFKAPPGFIDEQG